MSDAKLKPCPFCGGDAKFAVGKTSSGDAWHYVNCEDCGTIGPCVEYASHNIAVEWALSEAWNTRAEAAEAALCKYQERKKFPILGSQGATIDWQLVADHGGQAMSNHGQSVAGLANRGGLSWGELHAVLHDRRWQKMDNNEAMIACRSLEARYLAARTPPADPAKGVE